MAGKLGKREKIIVGLIIGVAAIGAVHFFVFQSKQQDFNTAKAEFEEKRTKAEGLASVNVNDAKFFDAFKEQTAKDERLLWKAVLDMNLIVPVYFSVADEAPKQPEGENPNPEDTAKYTQAMDAYKKRTDPIQLVAEAVLTERFERLIAMKKAYEAGQPWRGDSPAQGAPDTSVLKMPFLAGGIPDATGVPQNGWNLPIELNPSLTSGASLWDEVNALYGKWSVRSVMPEESPDYMKVNYEYIDQLKKMGLDKDLFSAIKDNLGEFLPEFAILLHARMIWNQRKEGDPIHRVGSNQELSLDLLKQMFGVSMPRVTDVDVAPQILNLNRQLWALEQILPLARRNKIEEIQIVKLYKIKWLGAADPVAIAEAKKPAAMTPAPAPRSLLAGNGGGANPASNMMAGYNAPAQGAAGAQPAPVGNKASVSWGGPAGLGSQIYMRYVASNENSTRFLYDILTSPQNFGIDSLTVYSMDNQKITVDLWFDSPTALFQISLLGDGNLVDSHGKPFTKVGEEMLAEWRKAQANDPASMESVVQKALAEAGLPADALEKLETPPPATPEATPAMPVMPGMPGMPAPAAAPEAEGSPSGLPELPAE